MSGQVHTVCNHVGVTCAWCVTPVSFSLDASRRVHTACVRHCVHVQVKGLCVTNTRCVATIQNSTVHHGYCSSIESGAWRDTVKPELAWINQWIRRAPSWQPHPCARRTSLSRKRTFPSPCVKSLVCSSKLVFQQRSMRSGLVNFTAFQYPCWMSRRLRSRCVVRCAQHSYSYFEADKVHTAMHHECAAAQYECNSCSECCVSALRARSQQQ